IYDDDVEIVTLNRADFQRLVTQSSEVWFINFYSTYCSHCHQLAPTVLHLTSDNIESLTTTWQPYDSRPWIIDFCDRSDSCLSSVNRRKLAAMLDGLVNVGSVDCTSKGDSALCERLDVTSGVRYYPTQNVDKDHEKVMSSLDPKELLEEALSYVDDLEEIEEKDIHELLDGITGLESAKSYPTSALYTVDKRVHKFVGYQSVQSIVEHIDLAPELQRAARSLRHFDERVHVGSVDCQAYGVFCRQHDYPQNMWRNADTIERWVFAMLPSLVTTLGNDYWHKVLDSDEPWLVDFYAPWCGHCVQFSPVFEQIAK
ncbi:hypothetical protein TELCIR_18777, partial [Teladorsagia circumcincta]